MMNLPGYDAWKTTDPYDDRYDRDEAAEELRTWEDEMDLDEVRVDLGLDED